MCSEMSLSACSATMLRMPIPLGPSSSSAHRPANASTRGRVTPSRRSPPSDDKATPNASEASISGAMVTEACAWAQYSNSAAIPASRPRGAGTRLRRQRSPSSRIIGTISRNTLWGRATKR
jgi:hypothetical protein